ncbi:15175_t:CDS:2 [Funneliformis caledonium]|uniref:15175_t:CDS:1 n=1 Tax=Funneliformis caledonium TaxID=1117310 RepID=A0A9N9AMH7_9GLOM|nr:15175_t:CDS:2 [Funneliformis caledonium]
MDPEIIDPKTKLTSAEQRSIYKNYTKHLNSLSIDQDLPQFTRDHAKKLLKELSDSIVEREKRHVIKEYDYKILEQVRSKHVSIGDADVAKVQRENEFRSDYESMYSPSSSEIEKLSSLAIDSVFNDKNDENDDNDDNDEDEKITIIKDVSQLSLDNGILKMIIL